MLVRLLFALLMLVASGIDRTEYLQYYQTDGVASRSPLITLAEAVDEIKIGILIRHRSLEEPLNKTLEMLNRDNTVLLNTRLTAIVEVLKTDNTYQASAAICRLMKQNVWAIIGPQSIQLTPVIQSITSYYHIPLILINWQPNSYHIDNSTQTIRKRHISPYMASALSNDNYLISTGGSGNGNGGGSGALDGDSIPIRLNYTINLFPVADQLSRAYSDMIQQKEWKSFTLIYDSSESFLLVKDIFEASFRGTSINVERIDLASDYPSSLSSLTLKSTSMPTLDGDGISRPTAEGTNNDDDISNNNSFANELEPKFRYNCYNHLNSNADEGISLPYRKLMKDLRKRGVENIVLSMSLDKVCRILKEAANVDLLSIYNDYIIANMDLHLLELSQIQPNVIVSNISGYSILDPEGQPTDFFPSKKWLGKRPTELNKTQLSTDYSMMSDAVSLLAFSLDELVTLPDFGAQVVGPSGGESRCKLGGAGNSYNGNFGVESADAWLYGEYLMDILKRTPRFGGYTGDFKFDFFGQRSGFNLEYIAYKNDTFKRLGDWNIDRGLQDSTQTVFDDFGVQAIKNKTLRVSIARTAPYVNLKPDHKELRGNDRYEGYCIDLMNKLAAQLQFNFVLHEVADGAYGKLKNGTWNGMIRELLDWNADLAIVDLTITKERQSAVDFTHPFMTLGIAILYKKPKLEEAELYSFLMPFSKVVWLSMGSAYLGTSIALWVVSRLSPLEWKNPHPCFDQTDERDFENELHSIGASLWFTIGSLMQQGSDLAPRSMSVRTLASTWYFFTLILISSYTANFAAFLTASRMQSPIESAEDLSKQTKIDYGCKDGGSTQDFFALSNHSTYRRMWNFMDSRKHQGVFPTSNDKGIDMVKRGNFAFLMESTSSDYVVQRNCELTQIGGLLDHKGYGIALRKRSPFRAALSKAIVQLNEEGFLQDLKNKWWLTDSKCDSSKDPALATSELGIDKVGGVFVLLGGGLIVALVFSLLEFVWKALKTSRDQREPVLRLLLHELLRILKFGPSKRPATETVYQRSSQQSQLSITMNSAQQQQQQQKQNNIINSDLNNNMLGGYATSGAADQDTSGGQKGLMQQQQQQPQHRPMLPALPSQQNGTITRANSGGQQQQQPDFVGQQPLPTAAAAAAAAAFIYPAGAQQNNREHFYAPESV